MPPWPPEQALSRSLLPNTTETSRPSTTRRAGVRRAPEPVRDASQEGGRRRGESSSRGVVARSSDGHVLTRTGGACSSRCTLAISFIPSRTARNLGGRSGRCLLRQARVEPEPLTRRPRPSGARTSAQMKSDPAGKGRQLSSRASLVSAPVHAAHVPSSRRLGRFSPGLPERMGGPRAPGETPES